MATISKVLTISESGAYDLDITLFQATVNISTTSSEFYGGTVTITSSVLSEPDTVTFDNNGSAVYVAKKAGTYNFAITYNGKTYERNLEIISEGAYNVKLSTLEIVGWGSATDEQLVAIVEALDNKEITTSDLPWAVGDERVVDLDGISFSGDYNVHHAAQQSTFVIMNVGAYNGNGHYVVGFKNSLKETEKMENTNTNQNGWHASRGMNCCSNIFKYMIPSSIKPIFKSFVVATASKGGSKTPAITVISLYMSLFAEKEIVGEDAFWSTQSEINDSRISQIDYYKVSANRIKYLGDDSTSAYPWFERSPRFDTTDGFCFIGSNGKISYTHASDSRGFAPFMVI